MKLKPYTSAPALCAVIYALLLTLPHILPGGEADVFAAPVLQLLIFVLPAFIYIRIRGERLSGKMRFSLFSADKIFITVIASAGLILAGILWTCALNAIGVTSDATGSNSVYDSFIMNDGLNIITFISAAVLPALFEEAVFRGVVLAEYERGAPKRGIIFSSLLFAMLHFSLTQFVFYFAAGIMLALLTYAARSIIPAIIAHFAYNIFSLLGQSYIDALLQTVGSVFVFVFVILLLFLLCITLFTADCGRIYQSYSKINLQKNLVPEYTKYEGDDGKLPRLREVILSPSLIICVVIFTATQTLK
jgi:membrane protease YdiL (CAAX protease family)